MAGFFGSIASTVRDALGWSARPDPRLSPSQRDEQAAFLAAIQANLDDDGPRLIYADWLDEQGGKSREARAEFIRVQCEHGLPIHHEYRCVNSAGRDAELLNQWRSAWEQEYSAFAGRTSTGEDRGHPDYQMLGRTWRRGFLCHVETQGVPDRESDAAANCLPFVQFWQLMIGRRDVARFRSIVATHDVANLKILMLSGPGAGDDSLRMLAESPYSPLLTHLSVDGCAVSGGGICSLMQARLVASLQSLNLSQCELTDDTVRILANISTLSGLRSLSLNDNFITDVGAIALAESPYLRSLKEIEVGNCLNDLRRRRTNIGARGRAALLESRAFADGCRISFLW